MLSVTPSLRFSKLIKDLCHVGLWVALLGLCALQSTAQEENFVQWHDISGRSFEAKIVDVSARDVRLENHEGKQIDFPIADLKPSSKDRIREWQTSQQAKAVTAGPVAESHRPTVFDEFILGNLVRLDGKRLKRADDATRPEKFYIFYYTASWCGPCQRYTPTLVEWYEENKNDSFELVLISSDRDEDAMEAYAESKSMPWPQLELKETEDFKEQFDHGVRGIPSVIVCDLDGKNLGNFRSRLAELSEMVK
jgi:nucleoredoxin